MTSLSSCRRVCLALALVLLAGCSAKAPPPSAVDVAPLWQRHLAELEALQVWSFRGRVGLRQGREAWNVKLRWRQSGDRYDLLMTAPWGQGAVRLQGEEGRAVLEVPDRPPLLATDPETLMEQQLGWQVPVSQLRYWLLGRPEPLENALLSWDGQGRVVHMEQAGWEIDYRRYGLQDGVSLPTKLELKNRALRVRLVIDDWQLHEDE